jgi:hypothetical protein
MVLRKIVSVLRKQRGALQLELKHIDLALGALNGHGNHKRRMSADARRRIGEAQRARWAKLRRGKK